MVLPQQGSIDGPPQQRGNKEGEGKYSNGGPDVNGSIAIPGQAFAEDGYLVPNDAPGFGMEIEESWLHPFFNSDSLADCISTT